MAENYTLFSFKMDLPEGKALTAANAINLLLSNHINWTENHRHSPGQPNLDTVFAAPLTLTAPAEEKDLALRLIQLLYDKESYITRYLEGKIRPMEMDLNAITIEAENHRTLYLYPTDNGDIETTALLVQGLIQAFNLNPVGFEYAVTCSKPSTGQFGGGAVFCNADSIDYINTYDWMMNKLTDHDEPTGRP